MDTFLPRELDCIQSRMLKELSRWKESMSADILRQVCTMETMLRAHIEELARHQRDGKESEGRDAAFGEMEKRLAEHVVDCVRLQGVCACFLASCSRMRLGEVVRHSASIVCQP